MAIADQLALATETVCSDREGLLEKGRGRLSLIPPTLLRLLLQTVRTIGALAFMSCMSLLIVGRIDQHKDSERDGASGQGAGNQLTSSC